MSGWNDPDLAATLEARLGAILAEVAGDLGVDPDAVDPLAGRFVRALASDGRLSAAALMAMRDEGARAARDGTPLANKVDVVLTTSWVLWGVAARAVSGGSQERLVELAATIMRGADLATAALAEGYTTAERTLAARTAAVRRGVLDELIAIPRLDPTGRARALRRAASIGLDPALGYRLLLIRLDGEIEDEGALPMAVERILDRAPARQPRLTTVHAGDLVLVLADPWRSRDSLPSLETELEARGRWFAVASDPVLLADLHEAFSASVDALRIAEALGRQGAFLPVRSLALERALLRDPVLLADAADRWLGPIAAAPRGADALLETLEAWIHHGQSVTATARALHVGVRTVSYRLDRVATLLGMTDLGGETGVRLATALLAHRLLEATELVRNRRAQDLQVAAVDR